MSDAHKNPVKSFGQDTIQNGGRPSDIAEMASRTTATMSSTSQGAYDPSKSIGVRSDTSPVTSKVPISAETRRENHGTGEGDNSFSLQPSVDNQALSNIRKEDFNIKENRTANAAKTSKTSELQAGLHSDVLSRVGLDERSSMVGQGVDKLDQKSRKLSVRSNESGDVLRSEANQNAVDFQSSTTYRNEARRYSSEAQSHSVDDDLDVDDLIVIPKRHSKNIDAMLGRSPAKNIATSDEGASDLSYNTKPVPNEEGVYPNGYSFPKPKPWTEATVLGFKAFLRYTFTPIGFFVVSYGLNVVAWGGMLFLLLCNASPAMCRLGDGSYDCNNIDSPRRVWVEIDSQIVNALFCVTGFGLIPWRFRDLYYWTKWRIGGKELGLRKLAGYHTGWFRLPNSDRLPVKDFRESQPDKDEHNSALPHPLRKTPAPPLTGARSPPTALRKMDIVIWAFVWNTFLQVILSGFMWGLNRYDRPSWSTGLFVALAMLSATIGGIIQFREGKKIKKVEGVPIEIHHGSTDIERSIQERNVVESEKTMVIENRNTAPG